jgi:hypothetical protein
MAILKAMLVLLYISKNKDFSEIGMMLVHAACRISMRMARNPRKRLTLR